ncbi:ATP-binding cassette sub-family G member 1-like [Oppia nitens]|uniref:ATP-binding cassette sub-family G member 1-like n=1 Tax=Oppia nitens TaxID=1686743 RepID=UPI0023DC52A2|nr:ATP-binding cassette sub-family G member 1-like [Oppia nitens]
MHVKVAPLRRTESSVRQVEIIWQNLTYCVTRGRSVAEMLGKSSGQSRVKTILNGISGSLRSGQMMALMGPSGAGKSSLLECISGKRTVGVSGDIKMIGKDRLKIGFVEQFDHHLEHLTVNESLVFASRLRNADRRFVNHQNTAQTLIKKLGLDGCANTLCIRLSGGQRKRLSIALELVSKVDVLILDEPTTGLDSSATTLTINAVLALTKQRKPIATIATIHQPSARIFQLFDRVYILSNTGVCVFDGPPQELPQTLSLVGLSVPNYYNPADFIIEVASGEYAKQSIHLLSHYNKESNKTRFDDTYADGDSYTTVLNAILAEKSRKSMPHFKQMTILVRRVFKITYRDPDIVIIRLFTVFPMAFIIGLIFGSSVGQHSGCPPTKLMLWKLDVNELFDKFQEDRYGLQENLALMFLVMMMCMFASYTSLVLSFPLEMNVVLKEYTNGYYSVLAYYVSKLFTDLPFCIITSISMTTIVYFMTGQLFDTYERLFYVNMINLLVCMTGQSVVILPLFIFAGFFRKLSLMPSYLVPISYVSFFRYSLTATLIAIFGFDRCPYENRLAELDIDTTNLTRPQWLKLMSRMYEFQSFMGDGDNSDESSEEQTGIGTTDGRRDPETNLMLMFGGKNAVGNNSERSLILTQFEIADTDEAFWWEIRLLIFFVSVMYVLIYLVLNWKLSRKR